MRRWGEWDDRLHPVNASFVFCSRGYGARMIHLIVDIASFYVMLAAWLRYEVAVAMKDAGL